MIGISYDLFWSLNPRKIKPFEKAFKLNQKTVDNYMWMMGGYVCEAVSVSLARSFSKGSSAKYRERPMLDDFNLEDQTEAQKMEKVENLFNMLSLMQANFERSKQEE